MRASAEDREWLWFDSIMNRQLMRNPFARDAILSGMIVTVILAGQSVFPFLVLAPATRESLHESTLPLTSVQVAEVAYIVDVGAIGTFRLRPDHPLCSRVLSNQLDNLNPNVMKTMPFSRLIISS